MLKIFIKSNNWKLFMGFLLVVGLFISIYNYMNSENKTKKKRSGPNTEKQNKEKKVENKNKVTNITKEKEINIHSFLQNTEPYRMGYEKEDLKENNNRRYFEIITFSRIDGQILPQCILSNTFLNFERTNGNNCGMRWDRLHMSVWQKEKKKHLPFRYRFLLGCEEKKKEALKYKLGYEQTYKFDTVSGEPILKNNLTFTVPSKKKIEKGEVKREVFIFEPRDFTDFYRMKFLKDQLGHVPPELMPAQKEKKEFFLKLKGIPFSDPDSYSLEYRVPRGDSYNSHGFEKQESGMWKTEFRVQKGGVLVISKTPVWTRKNMKNKVWDRLLYLVDGVKKKVIGFEWLKNHASIKRQSVQGRFDLRKLSDLSIADKMHPRVKFIKHLRGNKIRVLFKEILLKSNSVSFKLPEGNYEVVLGYIERTGDKNSPLTEKKIQLSDNYHWPPE